MDALLAPAAAQHPPADSRTAAVELLQREEGGLRRVIARYVQDAASVDDVFQEVSLKVLRRIDSVRDPQAVRGWLFQTARNASLDWLRRQDRRPDRSGVLSDIHAAHGDDARSPSEQFLSRERLAAVRRALDELPASQRETIRLRIEEGLDHLAISQRLGISRQAVEVRLCRGRAALKERLDAILGGNL
jgi:RNA polymerase sigma-70 factor (ECF subfamily)